MLLISLFFFFSIVFATLFAIRHFGPHGAVEMDKRMKGRIGPGDTGPGGNVRLNANISAISFFQKFLTQRKESQAIATLLKSARLSISVAVFLMISAILGLFTFLFVSQLKVPPVLALIVGFAIATIPLLILRFMRKRYIAKFEQYLPDTLGIISSSIKVGHGIEAAFAMVAKRAPYPVNMEFRTVQAEIKLGMTMRHALENLRKRIPTSPELRIFVIGIAVQQDMGGNLSELLDNLQKIIRDRFALLREIKTLSAQGIIAAITLFCISPFIILILMKDDPKGFKEFVTSPIGIRGAIACVILQIIAAIWMKKMLKIKD